MPRTTQYLLLALGVSGLLWYLARRNPAAVSDTLDEVAVTVQRVQALTSTNGYAINNPGNIRFIAANPWNGQIGNHKGYGEYDTPENGTRALGRQLLAYAARGLTTVTAIIGTWAPPGENNTTAYIRDVAQFMGVDPDARLNVRDVLPALAAAIARHENGYLNSSYDFEAWVYL